jgi:lipid II:glycine glycyltransferase (peptidoglycan interpeptide bridge formation enzyme)
MLAAIELASRRRKAWAVWIEPEALRDSDAVQALMRNGYIPSTRTIQPSNTIVVDISHDEDTILARMKSKTRYNIRLAERKGVQVQEGGLRDLDAFYNLMQVTSERDKFGIHNKRYYQRLLELFLPVEQAGLIFAYVEGEPTAALLVMALGTKAWYIAGASSNKHRKLMPTYAAQWAAIRWAKARGCVIYDLWGVPDADAQTLEAQFTERSDGLWGVYRFKRGFGGELIRYAGLWEKSLHPLYKLGTKFYNVINV